VGFKGRETAKLAIIKSRAPFFNTAFTCAVKGVGQQWVKVPPGNWIAPPGSNRGSGGSNETAEASGVEGLLGDSASMQAVIRVNAEQAPKRVMQEPTFRKRGEGRSWRGIMSVSAPPVLPG
jgi:hypothetical protein